MLFGYLPDEIFIPFASKSRHLYAAVLLDSFQYFFSDETFFAGLPERSELTARIKTVSERFRDELDELQENPENSSEAGSIADYPNLIYSQLKKSGWFLEIKEGYRIKVDMAPEAITLIAALQKIQEGIDRNYTGTVSSILSNLKDAFLYPEDHGIVLPEAVYRTKEFMHHLRAMVAGLRRMEENVMRQPDPMGVFRSFFTEFVEDFLMVSYKRLLTQNNPWRFRFQIIEKVRDILEDQDKLKRIATSIKENEQLPSYEKAYERSAQSLWYILRAFDGLDEVIETINGYRARVEKRAANTLRYMERFSDDDLNILVTGIEKLSLNREDNSLSGVLIPLLSQAKHICEENLYTPPKPVTKKPPRTRQIKQADPGLLLYLKAKREFAERLTVTNSKIKDFLSQRLKDKNFANGSDLLSTVDSLDDFFVFEALRTIDLKFKGHGQEFAVSRLEKNITSEWCTCRDFNVKRTERKTPDVG